MLAVLSAAMLHACATSPTDRPSTEPDPVIETRIVIKTVCPAEVVAPRPPRPGHGDDAVIQGNDEGMGWLGRLLTYMGLIEARLDDARGQCPHG